MEVQKIYTFDQSDYDSINEAIFNALGYEIKNNQIIESYWNVLPNEIKLDAEKWGVSDTEVQEKMVGWYKDYLLPRIKQMLNT